MKSRVGRVGDNSTFDPKVEDTSPVSALTDFSIRIKYVRINMTKMKENNVFLD